MALLFMDSFDHYAIGDITEKWNTSGVGSGTPVCSMDTGRFGGQSLKITNAASNFQITSHTFTHPAITSGGIGFAIKLSIFSTNAYANQRAIAAVYNGPTNNTQLCLLINADGTLSVARSDGGHNVTILGSGGALSVGVWYYIEWKWTLNNSTGSSSVNVNGANVIALTGQDTSYDSTTSTSIVLGGFQPVGGEFHTYTLPEAGSVWFDDVYIFDAAAGISDFQGDVTIGCLYPDADGNSHAWVCSTGTPDTGVDHDCVNETIVNDDTNYISTSTLNAKSTFSMQDVAAGADIRAIQIVSAQRKAAEGPGLIKHVVRSNSTDYDQAEQGIGGTSYAFLRSILEVDPATSAAWSESGFNAVEIGIKKVG